MFSIVFYQKKGEKGINMNNLFAMLDKVTPELISLINKIINKIKCRETRHLKRIMGFKNKKVIVTFSIFFSEKVNNSLHELITFEELEKLKDVIEIGNRIGITVEIPPRNQLSLIQTNDIRDEINIGGPLTNKYVHSYLSEFNEFVFYKHKDDKVENNYMIEKDCIQETKDPDGRYFMINSIKYYVDKETDYLFLIRFRQFNDNKITKTVHLIFNTHHNNNVIITRVYREYSKVIYPIIKKYKHNYFLVIPIDKNTGMFKIDKIEDRTTHFFKNVCN